MGPIRREDLFFDAGAVKISVRKTVDREDIGVGFFEPLTETREMISLKEFVGGEGRQAKADGEGAIDLALLLEQVTNAKRVGLQALQGFLPALCWVNIGAISEVGVLKFQKTMLLDHKSQRLAEEVDGVLMDHLFDLGGIVSACLHP